MDLGLRDYADFLRRLLLLCSPPFAGISFLYLIGVYYHTGIPTMWAPWTVMAAGSLLVATWDWRRNRNKLVGDEDKKFPDAERRKELIEKVFQKR